VPFWHFYVYTYIFYAFVSSFPFFVFSHMLFCTPPAHAYACARLAITRVTLPDPRRCTPTSRSTFAPVRTLMSGLSLLLRRIFSSRAGGFAL